MDTQAIQALAAEAVKTVGPWLPVLVNKAVEKTGEAIPGSVASAWKALVVRLRGKPEVSTAVADLAASKDDADLQAALRVQLKKLLLSDPDLVRELGAALGHVAPRQTHQVAVQHSPGATVASGDGAIAAAQGATVIVGAGGRARSRDERER